MPELSLLLRPDVLEACAPFGLDGIVWLAEGDPAATNLVLSQLKSSPLSAERVSPEEVDEIFREVKNRVMLAEG